MAMISAPRLTFHARMRPAGIRGQGRCRGEAGGTEGAEGVGG